LQNGQIDLHGLHISEAELCLEELMPVLQYIVKLFRSKQTAKLTSLVNSSSASTNINATQFLSRLTYSSPLVTTGRLRVVTGSGHHSVGIAHAGQVSRLLDHVKMVLRDHLSLNFADQRDKNGFVGGVVVDL
jgi:hypothetical protein